MIIRGFYFIVFTICFRICLYAQPAGYQMTSAEYIQEYKDDAIREMLKTGIPASITLAQALLESSNGNSVLARYANNHFGIKCHEDWTGATFKMDDDKKNECFRKYPDVFDSYEDHSKFLTTKERYANLFKLRPYDYKGWAKGLKKDGYATNPHYASQLIAVIQKFELYKYDKISKMPPQKPSDDNNYSNPNLATRTRILRRYNKVNYTVVENGDSYQGIANTYQLTPKEIRKFNDLNRNSPLEKGQVIYLQPKRNRSKTRFYTVKKGDTMWQISQRFGIKLKKLYKKNNMIPGTDPVVGQRLSLRRHIK